MTFANIILILIAVIAILSGIYILLQAMRKSKTQKPKKTVLESLANEQNIALPEQNLPTKVENSHYATPSAPVASDSIKINHPVSQETSAMPKVEPVFNTPTPEPEPIYEPVYQQPTYEQPNYTQAEYQQPEYQETEYQQPAYQQPVYQQPTYQQPNYQETYQTVETETVDTFSMLANATQTITPMVHTYDESKLKQSSLQNHSEVLDNHIQSQLEQEQNNPLNNAERNITITLIPSEPYDRISGVDVLKLTSRYGMKYGALKMFHRYENKDGTGILWFSMMMLTDNGIESFDLNRLPTQSLNGLALFLPLPHPQALAGFESMISLAKMMSVDLQATIYDESGKVLTKETILEIEEFARAYCR